MSVNDDLVILAELIAFIGVIIWALFAPGARRRFPDLASAPEANMPKRNGRSKNG